MVAVVDVRQRARSPFGRGIGLAPPRDRPRRRAEAAREPIRALDVFWPRPRRRRDDARRTVGEEPVSRRAPEAVADASRPRPERSAAAAPRRALPRRYVPLENAFFLSQHQAEAADVAAVLDLQMKIRGYKCWYDQDTMHITTMGMLDGIRSSAVFLLILTKGVMKRPFVLFELRAAIHLGKPIQLLHEADPQQPAYAPVSEIRASAPDDLKTIFDEAESLPFRRKIYEQQALLDQMLLYWAAPLEKLKKALAGHVAEAPSVLANEEMAKIVRRPSGLGPSRGRFERCENRLE